MSLTMNNTFVKTHSAFLSDTSPPPQPRNSLLAKKIPTENNNQIPPPNGLISDKQKTLQVWSQYKFGTDNLLQAAESGSNNFNRKLPSWAAAEKSAKEEKMREDDEPKKTQEVAEEEEKNGVKAEGNDEQSPSHHARRPMNAFLIFCKKHRPIVRDKYPNLENRSVTKILGEWWAVLADDEKKPFTALAREHKDAFLSANPDFKWYKLPAPPLRTLNVRPTSASLNVNNKVQSPVSSPTLNNNLNFVSNHQTAESEFNPGKLADESQLGSLTSLMNNNFTPPKLPKSENNNNDVIKNDDDFLDEKTAAATPANSAIKASLPPKPFKKRSFEKYPESKNIARNILQDDDEMAFCDDSMTTQDIVDKVVDKNFTEYDYDGLGNKELVRKSGRKGKGNRYEKFMVEGRLLGNKRDTKLTQKLDFDSEPSAAAAKTESETPNLDLTIKRLAERTNQKTLLENGEKTDAESSSSSARSNANSNSSQSQSSNFNLNIRIDNLPCLSYDVYMQRKRDSKKRKSRSRTDSETRNINNNNNNNKVAKLTKHDTQLVGSKKRKNKRSITHLEKKRESSGSSSGNNEGLELLALTALAEVAANEQKINDKNL